MLANVSFIYISGSIAVLESSLSATLEPGHIYTPRYPSMYVGNMEIEYKITTPGNNLIMLQVRMVNKVQLSVWSFL